MDCLGRLRGGGPRLLAALLAEKRVEEGRSGADAKQCGQLAIAVRRVHRGQVGRFQERGTRGRADAQDGGDPECLGEDQVDIGKHGDQAHSEGQLHSCYNGRRVRMIGVTWRGMTM